MDDLIAVVRALIDAAFGTGGITDTQHTELQAKLDGVAQPPAPEPAPEPEPPAAPPVAAPGFSSEETGFGG